MEFDQVVRERRSIRRYKKDDLPDSEILSLIELASYAPSSGDQQMWHFIIIKNQEIKEKMSQLVSQKIDSLARQVNEKFQSDPKKIVMWFSRAPVVLAVTTFKYRTVLDNMLFKVGYSEYEVDSLRCRPDLQSVGAAIQNLLLAAHSRGYGGCWLTGPMVARPDLEELLEVKPPRSLAALVALGWSDYISPPRNLRPLEEITSFIK
ncbi:MAG TPA: hypothetical protein DCK76_11425 [Desulfotomaculum sp.]|nr:MAG: Nitroreductase family protein [Desulfotomaculum sp. 46_80]HAG11955.1 hypothetical protein [Desulfotomaculum sp.]HBY04737.1 hypothetical protein [Desulfotomaculum sp.]